MEEDDGLRCAVSPWLINNRSRPFAGNLLVRRLLAAIPEARQTRRDHLRFTDMLEQEYPQHLAATREQLAAWTDDKSQPDPYILPRSSEFQPLPL